MQVVVTLTHGMLIQETVSADKRIIGLDVIKLKRRERPQGEKLNEKYD